MERTKKIDKGALMLGLILLLVLFLETHQSYGFLQTVISVRGNILNKETGSGLNTKIEVKDNQGKIVFRTKTFESTGGEYYITGLKPDKNYRVYINSSGFEKANETVKTPDAKKFTEIEKDFKLRPIK